jgi:ADP-glucose pyrophosphorylase
MQINKYKDMVIKTYTLISKARAYELIKKHFPTVNAISNSGQNFVYWTDCGLWQAYYDKKNDFYLDEGELDIFGEKTKLICVRRK